MSDPNTLRVLSIDGGGMRGYMPNKFMQLFIQQWGISPSDIWKNFDVIAGTSIGGILALAYATGMTPEEIEPFFTETGPWIFTSRTAAEKIAGSHTAANPSLSLTAEQKVAEVLINDPFYKSPYSDSNYGDLILQQALEDTFGTNTLQTLKTNTLIPAYKYDTNSPILYSNLNYAEFTGQNELIKNVALDTSAAPLYLPSIIREGHIYIDGGVYQNNPAQLALTLAKMLKPTANRYCVLSLGTGLGELGFDTSALRRKLIKRILGQGPSSNVLDEVTAIELLAALFDISITGGQESVAKSLELEAKYTLSNLYNYRFQSSLDPDQDTELDSSKPEFIEYMNTTTEQYYNDDIENITNFLGHLTA